jgi:VWFA-related protein
MQKFVLALVFIVCSFGFSFGQNPTPTPKPVTNDEDVVKISTTLIQVDVTVTDKSGKIVTDLKPEDFEVFENDEKQQITNFSFISVAPKTLAAPTPKPDKNAISPPIPPVNLRPEQVRQTITLVVDNLYMSFESLYYVKRALKKFVDERMQPSDLVAIITTGNGSGMLQQFTSDKKLLYKAIGQLNWNALNETSAFATINKDTLRQETDMSDEPSTETRDRGKESRQLREEAFTDGTLAALNYIVNGLVEMPGRKSLMFFSDGFSICADEDLLGNDSDPTRCNKRRDEVKRLTDLCNRASVVIYTQDARGLQSTMLSAVDNAGILSATLESSMNSRSAELQEKREGLFTLARDTGGQATINNNDMGAGIEKLLEDQKGYYLLGYQPDTDSFDAKTRKFNQLKVKVNRPDLTVRYRSGFFGIADSPTRKPVQTALTPVQQIQKALTSPFSANGINLRLNTLFGKDEKNSSVVNTVLHIEAKDLQFTDAPDGTKKAKLDILAVNYSENGAIADQIGKTYTVTVNNEEGYREISEKGFIYQFPFQIKKPGAYQMRVAIRDAASANIGTAHQFIEIPDLKKGNLTLSGIILENLTQTQWLELQKNPASPPDTNPMLDTSLRRFKRGTALRYFVEIYNAKSEQNQPPNLTTQIRLFRNGELVLDGKPNPFNTKGQTNFGKMSFRGAFALGNQMETGDYVLQIVLIDNLQKEKRKLATQWVQFEVIE